VHTARTSPEVQTCLQWLSVFQLLLAFLDAVKHDPAAFAILLVACSSIIDSLCGNHADFPLVSILLLAPVHWANNLMVWCTFAQLAVTMSLQVMTFTCLELRKVCCILAEMITLLGNLQWP
jgi:hypothetical protein